MADPGIEWTKILTNPLGLVGYVLFLLFGLAGSITRRNERRWLFPVALAAAVIALLGGLGLAYRDVGRQASAPNSQAASSQQGSSQTPANSISTTGNYNNNAIITGDNNAVVQGVKDISSVSIVNNSGGPQPEKKQKSDKKSALQQSGQSKAE